MNISAADTAGLAMGIENDQHCRTIEAAACRYDINGQVQCGSATLKPGDSVPDLRVLLDPMTKSPQQGDN